ncbi:MAG: fibronectin type III domain-containing protein [Planctomycetota bacterium]
MKLLLDNLDILLFALVVATLGAVVGLGIGSGAKASASALERAETSSAALDSALETDRFQKTELATELAGLTNTAQGIRTGWSEGPRPKDLAAGLFYHPGSLTDAKDGRELEIRFQAPRALEIEPLVGGIRVTWELNNLSTVVANGFVLYRKSGDEKSSALVKLGAEAREYFDRAVQPGTLYSYEVTAVSSDPVLARLQQSESPRSRAVHARPKRDYEVALLDWIPAEKRARVMIRKFSDGVWHEKQFDAREDTDLGQKDVGSGVDYRTNCHIQKITSGVEFVEQSRLEVLFDIAGRVLFDEEGKLRRRETTYIRERQVVTLEYRNELGQKEKLILKR